MAAVVGVNELYPVRQVARNYWWMAVPFCGMELVRYHKSDCRQMSSASNATRRVLLEVNFEQHVTSIEAQ
jgi:fatty-acid desaturase